MNTAQIALISALLVSLAGCSAPTNSSGTTTTGRGIAGGEIETVEHNGHLFTVWDGAYAGGIIHSPSCPCQQATK